MGNDCLRGRINSSDLDRELHSDITGLETPSEKVKFLLLGAGESGKSTLFKQMKINYVKNYSEKSLIDEKSRIVFSVIPIFDDFRKALHITYGSISDDPKVVEAETQLFPNIVPHPEDTVEPPKELTPAIVSLMKTVWNSERGIEMWKNHHRYSIVDCLEYFMENLDRVASPDFVPTEMDFLKCRIITAGIHEQTFLYKGVTLYVVDVGGQRSERRKWIQCFDGVTAVMFVASLSEFDQVLYEEASSARLVEAIDLFRKTLGFFIFKNTPFILFLNKRDLLEQKLSQMQEQGQNLDEYFPELQLGTNYENAFAKVEEYLKNEFLAVVPAEKKHQIFPQIITATDTDAFRNVFNVATAIVLQEALQEHFTGEI